MRSLSVALVLLLFLACDRAPLAPAHPAELAQPALDVTSASVPSNDVFSGATVVTIPFSDALNTTEATTDADDAQLNASCGAPATDASVWYAFTPAADAVVVVNVSQSDYSAGVLVGMGTQGNLWTVACGPGAVSFWASAANTYYVLAIDDQSDGGGNGGSLNVSFTATTPPATTLDAFTVDRFGSVDTQTGIATIRGTYACSNGDYLSGSVDARQNVGRFTIMGSGGFFEYGTCDGALHNWAATVVPQNGRFAGGKSMTVTFVFTCGWVNCAYGYVEQTVVLRGGPLGTRLSGAIAFHRGATFDGDFEIYVMNADGSNVTRVTYNDVNEFDPIWSPSGNHLAFGRCQGTCDVVVINADGSGERVLVNDGFPSAWSPDGERIAFGRNGGVFVINADGSGLTQLTDDGSPTAWSPNGKQIAFQSFRDGDNDIYVMNVDGSGVVQLTNDPASDEGDRAGWSPDGKRIVFSSRRDGGDLDLFVMNADGSGVIQLTHNDFIEDDDPVWSPDGRHIAFHSTRDGDEEIFVINADGSNPIQLTFNEWIFDAVPAWRARTFR